MVSLRADFWEGDATKHFSVTKTVFSDKGVRVQWMRGLERISTGKAIQWRGPGDSVNCRTLKTEKLLSAYPSQKSVFNCLSIGDKFGESLVGSQASPSFWEVPGLPRRFRELPRKFSATSPEVLPLWKLTAIQRFPGSFRNFPGSSPNFPGSSGTSPEVSPCLWEAWHPLLTYKNFLWVKLEAQHVEAFYDLAALLCGYRWGRNHYILNSGELLKCM